MSVTVVVHVADNEGCQCQLLLSCVSLTMKAVRLSVTVVVCVADVQQQPMYCLSDVMKFFVSTVGPTARPLRSAVSTTRLVSSDVWSSFAVEPDDAARHSCTQRGYW